MYTRPEDDPEPPHPSRPRRMTIYQTRQGRPRWILHMQAVFWRVLMRLGMFFHKFASPRPPKPNFYREIPSTISGKPGKIVLYFYTPRDYFAQRRLWIDKASEDLEPVESGTSDGSEDPLARRKSRRLSVVLDDMGSSIRRMSTTMKRWGGYPVVVNFHGGGFTLGSADDDARWCTTVVNECHAVVVSVDYRLAPEHPFPTAVEDGVDAVAYLHKHAQELGIDKDKIALSGFSSGANMCFTVPLRLHDEQNNFPRDEVPDVSPTARQKTERAIQGAAPTLDGYMASGSNSTTRLVDADAPPPQSTTQDHALTATSQTKLHLTPTVTATPGLSDVKIRMIVPWYPPVDYTRSRAQRRATSARADQELPALFTDLFDDSYLHPPNTIALQSPYLSPGVAPTGLLANALPHEIIMHTCEWDMLLDEGRAFAERLTQPEIDKHVVYKMIEEVPHGWDKAPNPWKPTPGVREHYLRACKEMRRVFWSDKGRGAGAGPGQRPPIERETTKGWPTAAPRGSVQVVR
ncbi:Alpha/Beta hydrolase protein [Neohortaea acidophila]|uniref:Alpha/Beta hydrolase protein n=1 Tax=Neohortaea acidophila TaxID=245834 RepID=A0A6A6Q6F7_9PEZI|nr:Alpha/Beta hydrolase protein [Neohortaea acidophila]KAF2487556.1 Alpha/Beta hydrolase protein [Neohortaea acidophila]